MRHSFVNAVYFPSWKIYQDKSPLKLDATVITHVFYAFIGVNSDGTLRHLDEWADLQKEVDGFQGCFAALAALKQTYPHIKTIISVGGGTASEEFPALAANESARTTFAHEICQFCDRHRFDGADIDWEHPRNPVQGENFVKLLQAIRDASQDRELILTAALPAQKYCLQNLDLRMVSRLLDYMNLMAYDFTGNWTEVAGHHAQLEYDEPLHGPSPHLQACGSGGVEYVVTNGFSSHKVLLGVSIYARHFVGAWQPGDTFSGTKETDYCDLPDDWIHCAHVDELYGVASYVDWRGGMGFVSFDVPRTVEKKAEFVRTNSLGGLFYWAVTGDKGGELSLVWAGYEKMAMMS